MNQTTIHHPPWLKVKLPAGKNYIKVKNISRNLGLHTVCESARCPNIAECWGKGTATFIILGDTCTRKCGFCSVRSGHPKPPDLTEPKKVADAIKSLGIRHSVITSVTRDDLSDGGAGIFVITLKEIRALCPKTTVEVLIPDFRGSRKSLEVVLEAKPDVLAHNIETVPRLYKSVRPNANYKNSLAILSTAKKINPRVKTKTGIMVGLGETYEELLAVMDDLVKQDIDIFTIGQYLRPSLKNLPVVKFYHPREFNYLEFVALKKGIRFIQSGPLVRSSYHAEMVLSC